MTSIGRGLKADRPSEARAGPQRRPGSAGRMRIVTERRAHETETVSAAGSTSVTSGDRAGPGNIQEPFVFLEPLVAPLVEELVLLLPCLAAFLE